jgi:hypothetical protein
MMTLLASSRDALLVGRFEVLRAIRTWRVLALIIALLAVTLMQTWAFISIIRELESTLADTLGVATTSRPGMMMDQLRQNDEVISILAGMVGSKATVRELLHLPLLAIWELGFGMGVLPLIAAGASAESVAIDVGTRAIRFEALRTGRAEIVAGRFLGQVLLMAIALAVSLAGSWALGLVGMVGHTPWGLAAGMVWVFPRLLVWCVPFIGLGVFTSQLTASPAWARALAIVLLGVTYVIAGVRLMVGQPWATVGDALAPLLPQTWSADLFQPGFGWLISACCCVGLGVAYAAVGSVRFLRRDL